MDLTLLLLQLSCRYDQLKMKAITGTFSRYVFYTFL